MEGSRWTRTAVSQHNNKVVLKGCQEESLAAEEDPARSTDPTAFRPVGLLIRRTGGGNLLIEIEPQLPALPARWDRPRIPGFRRAELLEITTRIPRPLLRVKLLLPPDVPAQSSHPGLGRAEVVCFHVLLLLLEGQ